MKETYTVKEVADILGYSTNSIYSFLKEKRIKGVRLGKGRFRISHTELESLLHLSKNSVPIETEIGQIKENEEHFEPVQFDGNSFVKHLMNKFRMDIPSIFDWFAGISSIILGLSMFVFTQFMENGFSRNFSQFIPAFRISLILGGLGLLISCMSERIPRIWHRLFHLILIVIYTAASITMWKHNETDASILFSLVSLCLVLSCVFSHKGIFTYGIFQVLFFAFVPIGILAAFSQKTSPANSDSLFFAFSQNPDIYSLLWLGFVFSAGIFAIWSYFRNKIFFLIMLFASSCLLIALSSWYAQNQQWSRSFILIIMALTNFFVPAWNSLQKSQKKSRNIVFATYLIVGLVLSSAIGVIKLIQVNMYSYAKDSLNNKLINAKIITETAFENIGQSLESLSQNSSFQEAVAKGKEDLLNGLSRGLFESNKYLQRVLVLDSKGDVLSLYPYGILKRTNFSDREYFTAPKLNGKLFISEIFTADAENNPQAIAVSIPIFDKNNEFSGILMGGVNLNYLSNRLQQTVNSKNGEYVIATDKEQKIAVHSNAELIGAVAPSKELIRKDGSISEIYNQDIYSLETEGSISSPDWTLAVIKPISSIYGSAEPSMILIFYFALSIIVVIGGLIFFIHKREAIYYDT